MCFVLITCVILPCPVLFNDEHVDHLSSVWGFGHLSLIKQLYLSFIARKQKTIASIGALIDRLIQHFKDLENIEKVRAGLSLTWSK